jgi:hypothetical protein
MHLMYYLDAEGKRVYTLKVSNSPIACEKTNRLHFKVLEVSLHALLPSVYPSFAEANPCWKNYRERTPSQILSR